jgi:hypothetical protein
LHWLGPVQRSWPSTSWSQRPSQHWLPVVHEVPVGRHDDAGTSHRPPALQLSEQQSLSFAHDLAYGRHVEQFTPTKHAVPKQQPFVHEVALHWHAPLTHCWPLAHCVPPPHVHEPEALQPSASVGSHATHACPGLPQAPTDVGVLHVLPLQQPAQVWAHVWQAPMLQALAPQSAHEPPNAPQTCGSVPVWHLPFVSQQPWQLVPLHTHLPFTHARPCVASQEGLLPHEQAPFVHESAVVGSQTEHGPPALPQLASDAVSHVAPLQHPLAQVVALHATAASPPSAVAPSVELPSPVALSVAAPSPAPPSVGPPPSAVVPSSPPPSVELPSLPLPSVAAPSSPPEPSPVVASPLPEPDPLSGPSPTVASRGPELEPELLPEPLPELTPELPPELLPEPLPEPSAEPSPEPSVPPVPPHAVPKTTTADSNNPRASAGNVRCDMVPPSIPRSTRYSTANDP